MTLLELLEQRRASQPGQRFLRFEDGDLSYEELAVRAETLANQLRDGGIRSGDRVATVFSNGPDAVVAWFGLAIVGAVEVPINTALKGQLLGEQLETSRVVFVMGDDDVMGEMAPLIENLPGREGSVGGEARDTFSSGLDDPSLILYTSGTTGRSKGVVLSQRATMRLAGAIVDHAGLEADDVLYTPFPLFHIAARFVSVVVAMLIGGTVVVHRGFSASRFWDICRDEGITAIHYLGTLPMMLWKQPKARGDQDNPVRLAYGAGLPAGIFEDFEQRYGLVAYELYGSTEQGIATMTRADARRAGTCGTVVDDIELEIHDEIDRPVPAGTPGEIVVRPSRPGIFFSGYDALPVATLEAWRNLWFHTGDLGTLDEDGYLTFGGRLKDAIRRRGENISAWEVERVLLSCPGVADAAAVGVASELGEEEVLAVVVADEEGLDPVDVVDHCRQQLPRYAVPRYVRIVPSLPRTPSDRVKKYLLRDEGVTADTWDGEGR